MTNDLFASLSPEDLPRQQARETFVPRVLRVGEIDRLISEVTDTYMNAVIVLAFTGLRLANLQVLSGLMSILSTASFTSAKHSRR